MKILKLTFSLGLIAYIVFFSGCEKDKEENPAPKNKVENTPEKDTEMLNRFIQENKPEKQVFEVASGSQTIIKGAKGTEITIPGNSFTDRNGTPVSGPVSFELIEVLSKKDMILAGTQTVTTDGQLLISGGMVYLNAMKDGDTLSLSKSVTVSVPTKSVDPDMSIFLRETDANGNFTWDLKDSSFFYQAVNNYIFSSDDLTWINIDKLPENPMTTTNLTIKMPEGFHYTAINPKIILDDELAMLSIQFGDSPQYTTNRISLNTNITVWFFGVKNEQLYTYKESFQVTENLSISPVMELATEEEVIAVLDSF